MRAEDGVRAAHFSARQDGERSCYCFHAEHAVIESPHMRVSPSGKAPASQAGIRGFESRHPLQKRSGPSGARFLLYRFGPLGIVRNHREQRLCDGGKPNPLGEI